MHRTLSFAAAEWVQHSDVYLLARAMGLGELLEVNADFRRSDVSDCFVRSSDNFSRWEMLAVDLGRAILSDPDVLLISMHLLQWNRWAIHIMALLKLWQVCGLQLFLKELECL